MKHSSVSGLLALFLAVPVMGAACTSPVESESAAAPEEEVGVAEEAVAACRPLGTTYEVQEYDSSLTCGPGGFMHDGDPWNQAAAAAFCGTANWNLQYYGGPDTNLARFCHDYPPGNNPSRGWTSYFGCCDPTTCAHSICDQGDALNSACSSCVAAVCAQDNWCCSVSWDGLCVSEVATYCGSDVCTGP